MDTAARFAPAYGTPAADATAANGDNDDDDDAADAVPMEEPRPADANAAWLWDRGYSAAEAASASAATSGGDAAAGLQVLFRHVLTAAAPEGGDWDTWPQEEEDEEEEDDQWEEEMVAVEAIFGATFVGRPSPNYVEVSVESPLGWVTLEVTRPSGMRYPASEPPMIALVGVGGGAGGLVPVPRGALRGAGASTRPLLSST